MRILLCVLLVCFVAWKPTKGDRPEQMIDPSLISFGPGGSEGMQMLFEASLDAYIERSDPLQAYALIKAMEAATKIEDKEERERELHKLLTIMFSQTSPPEDEDAAEESADERGEL